ncbi:MAG: amino acid permease, partial [Myxococcota bacterium]
AFAIISQALGLEAGGAIGIPLYIAQAASAAMYIYAFAESWAIPFPDHPPVLVAGIAFAGVALLAWRSANLAMKAQGVMLFVVIAALLSAAGGLFVHDGPLRTIQLVGALPDAGLVTLFAIFFPAFTGIMVGAGMSGSLTDPRRAIPRGTLMAWGVTLVIYVFFAVWYALIAPPEVLIDNRAVMIDEAAFPIVVLVGLLCSTLMAALSSLVAAPRLLAAMAQHEVVPGSAWLAQETHGGEPRNAVLATTGIAALGLAAGSLDAIAPIITSFFIMTYMTINGIVYTEKMLGMISFRPAFRVSSQVSLAGALLCMFGLAVSSPFVGLAELLFVLSIYFTLSFQKLETPWETVRSGITVTMAAWAARNASHIERSERAWKPDVLVPTSTVQQVMDLRPLVEALAHRSGSIRWVALGPREDLPEYLQRLTAFESFDGFYSSWTRLRTTRYMEGIGLTLDALRGALFPPNLVLVDERKVNDTEIAAYLNHCRELSVDLALWQPHQNGGMGEHKIIDVWLSDRAPEWQLRLHLANLDLPVLIGFLMAEAWGAQLRLRTIVRDPEQLHNGEQFLLSLIDQARLPPTTTAHAQTGDFLSALREAADADVNLFGMPPTIQKDRLQQIQNAAGGSCLWLMDLGSASAIA